MFPFDSWSAMSRTVVVGVLAYLERLDACGVAFKSYTGPFPDTDNELIAHIVSGSRATTRSRRP